MTPLTDKLDRMSRIREGAQQTSRTQKQEPNPLAEAGQSYVKQNPAPDPRAGVAMSISVMGRRAQENPQDKVMAQDKDGSVVRKQEAKAQETQDQPKSAREAMEAEKKDVQQVKNTARKEEPKTPREAVEAVAKKREEEVTRIQSPAQEKEEAIMKAKPPVPGKDELEDVSLEGTVSLKEYQEQRAQKAAEAQGGDMLKVA